MRKYSFRNSNISAILWVALGVLIVCVSATFLHVFDIEKLFKEQAEDALSGHAETAVSEIQHDIDFIKNLMTNFHAYIESGENEDHIQNVIISQEHYAPGYDFYYLTKEGFLVSKYEAEFNGDLYDSLEKISEVSLSNGFVTLPALHYFPEEVSGKSIIGVKRIKDDSGENYYLIIKRDLEDVMSIGTFDYINKLGTFAITNQKGDVIASSHSFNQFFEGCDNIFDGLEKRSGEFRVAKKNEEIRKNFSSGGRGNRSFTEDDGKESSIYFGKMNGSIDLYYVTYFKSGVLDDLVAKSTIRSYMVCFSMMFIMIVLVIYTWVSLNSSNEKMVKLAYKDSVTGGYNFNYFKNKAGYTIVSQREMPFIILRFDIMNFRYINEAYGHDKADKVLTATIKEFEKYFDTRKELCVRVNSDQFVALCINDLDFDDRYMKYVKGISDSANECGVKFPIRLKVGMYQVRKEDTDVQLMIDRANAARKSIDISQNVLLAVYSDNIIKDMRKVDAIESEMHNSLNKGEFRVYIQPKWDIVEDRIMGGEALVRWIKEDGTVVYPSDFIPIFESNGFIENLDFYMLEQLCIKMKEMRKTGNYRFFPISINQSRVLINNPDYVRNVDKVLTRYEADVSMIQLEITENVFFDQRMKMIEVVKDLKNLGLDLAMDDFGSGYSSLNILKDIPFDILKIDKDFFDESFISNASTVILQKILEMAKLLGIDVICEGVETKEQVEMLKKFGCHAVQGYFYGKPMPMEEFIEKYCVIDNKAEKSRKEKTKKNEQ